MATDRMACVSCGKTKAWPDGFPNRIEATCWQCAWNGHLHAKHPRLVRKVLRDVKRRARARAERDEMKAATDNELAILVGTPRPEADR